MDVCNTGLVLGLGLSESSTTPSKVAKRPCLNFDQSSTVLEPSLTLGLSGDSSYSKFGETTAFYRQASPTHCHSAVSSFSSGRVKRESEETEVERVSSRISDEDDEGVNARKKLRLTKEQSALLEESFKQHSTLNPVINSFHFLFYLILSLNDN